MRFVDFNDSNSRFVKFLSLMITLIFFFYFFMIKSKGKKHFFMFLTFKFVYRLFHITDYFHM